MRTWFEVVMLGAACGACTADNGAVEAQCRLETNTIVDGGCTRCWPAAAQMCGEGNPGAVLGLLHCLTNGTCWDVGDFNTAGPCMQNVIATYGDSNVTSVENTATALGCSSDSVLSTGAVVTELTETDRAKLAACVAAIAPDAGCSATAFDACLAQTHYDMTLCRN